MALKLSKEEKRKIFWNLLKSYPDYARQRSNISLFDSIKEEKEKYIATINKEEKEMYDILVKLGKEIGQDLPEYVLPK